MTLSITLTYDKTKPTKPSGLKLLDIGHNRLTIGWSDNSDNERGFNLYIDGVKQAVLDINSTSYEILNLAEETTYAITLKAFNDRGESSGVSIEGITDIDRSEYLKSVLKNKCGVSESNFDRYFDKDTGVYSTNIYCYNKGLTDSDLENFKALKEVRGYLNLSSNQFTNVDGLSNLKKVTSYLYLQSNKLTNVDGLYRLEVVENSLYLYNNKLTNVNGLINLKRVGYDLYLYSNNLTNINGLSSLTSIGHYLNLHSNNLTNLNGLYNLTHVGSYINITRNERLIDISGIQNVEGTDGKAIYIDGGSQYSTKAPKDSKFCSVKWDLRDATTNIADDMNQICDMGEDYELSEVDKFRDVLGKRCSISSSTFYDRFNKETGVYRGDINCQKSWNTKTEDKLTSEELLAFKPLKEITGSLQFQYNILPNIDGLSSLQTVGGSFYLYNNKLTNVDGLSNLKSVGNTLHLYNNKLTNINGLNSLISVGSLYLYKNQLLNINGLTNLATINGSLYLQDNNLTNLNSLNNITSISTLRFDNNANLTNILGIQNIEGIDGKVLYIDGGNQYTTKAPKDSKLCSVKWDLRDTTTNISDDMSQICEVNEDYELSEVDKFRDTLGEKCNISSSVFYSKFDEETGLYNGTIDCSGRRYYQKGSFNSENLRNFNVLKEVTGDLNLRYNKIVNLDGLSNLEKVGRNFYLEYNTLENIDGLQNLTEVSSTFYLYYNLLINLDGLRNLKTVGGHLNISHNKLTDITGLSSLTTVGSTLSLANNKLTNVNGLNSLITIATLELSRNQLLNINGLNSLTTINSSLNIQDNNLTDVDGLSNLISIKYDLNLYNNKLINLNGLSNLTSLRYLKIYNNENLRDISGIQNIVGTNGKLIYIDKDQYTTKAPKDSDFCSATWDLRDKDGNIPDDMTQVCDMEGVELSDADKLRNVLGDKCGISSSTFYDHYDEETGVYNTSISCREKGLTSEDLLNFKGLKEVRGDLDLYRNQLINVDGLSNLKKVTRSLYLYQNQLENIDGLSNLEFVGSSLYLQNNKLTNVNGLSKLTNVGGLYLYYNQLTNVDGLSSLTQINGSLSLYHNQLTNIDGLSHITTIGGSLELQVNKLTNVDGLSNLITINYSLNLRDNQLTNLNGLSSLTTILKYLYIQKNPTLTDISGIKNLQAQKGKYLYIDANQYTTKADKDSDFCSATWDLRDKDGNIADDMTQICVSDTAYTPTDADKFRDILGSKCSVPSSSFYNNFDEETGVYNTSISCANKNLTSEDLLDFKALKEVRGYFNIHQNKLTNVDGLSNLKKITNYFNLFSNQLENVDGLSSLESVGGSFSLYNNKLANLNGLNRLKSVGGSFSLYNNKITQVDGLSSLISIKGSLNLENNLLKNLNGLKNLIELDSSLVLKRNDTLINISGISNINGKDGQRLYIDLDQYTTKANENLKFCSNTWNLYDRNSDIDDNMSLVCGAGEEMSQEQKFKNLMEEKCSVSYSQFDEKFDATTGVFDGSLDCSYSGMSSDELSLFSRIKKVKGSFSLNNNNFTNIDGLSNLVEVEGYLYLQNSHIENIDGLSSLTKVLGDFDISGNSITNLDALSSLINIQGSLKIYHNDLLIDISGISNIFAVDGDKIYIDTTHNYTTKATDGSDFCSARWDIYGVGGNIDDNISLVCDGVTYEATTHNRLRDILGRRCSIDSLTFYSHYDEELGKYSEDIACSSVIDSDMDDFEALLEVDGDFAIEDSSISKLDGLIRLKKVTGSLSIQNNSELIDIYGLSNIEGIADKRLIIDDATQYTTKADGYRSFCETEWNIYQGSSNISDNMENLCTDTINSVEEIISALSSGESNIVVKNGTYTISKELDIKTDGTVFRGESKEGTIIQADTSEACIDLFYVGANHVTVSNITLKQNPNCNNTTFVTAKYHHITLKDSILYGSDNMFTVYFAGKDGDPLEMIEDGNLDHHNQVINNEIFTNNNGNDVLSFSLQKDGVVSGNILHSGLIALYLDRNVSCFNNIMNNPVSQGIFLSLPSYDVTINNNTIKNPKSAGIKVARQVDHNDEDGNSRTPLSHRSTNIYIKDNNITDSRLHGIEINNLADSNISGNYIENSDFSGIYLYYSDRLQIANNNIIDANMVAGGERETLYSDWNTAWDSGIYLEQHITDSIIENNIVNSRGNFTQWGVAINHNFEGNSGSIIRNNRFLGEFVNEKVHIGDSDNVEEGN